MTQTQSTPMPFLEALKRIEELTRTIRTDGLDAFETIEGAFEEVRELRAVLGARIADMRRMTSRESHADTIHSYRQPGNGRI